MVPIDLEFFFTWFSKYGTQQIACLEACFQAHKGKLHISIPYGFLLIVNSCMTTLVARVTSVLKLKFFKVAVSLKD